MERKSCEIFKQAKELAINNGLGETKVKCPFFDVCQGKKFYMFDPLEPEENWQIYEDMKRLQVKE